MKQDRQWQPGCELSSRTLALCLSDRQYLRNKRGNSVPTTAISK